MAELQRAAVAREHALRALDHVERRASWHEYVNARAEDKRALLARPGLARRGPRRVGRLHLHAGRRSRCPSGSCSIGGEHSGESLADAIARTGAHPSDVLADWLLATDLDGTSAPATGPSTTSAAVDVLRSPFTPVGCQRRRRARPDVQRRRRRHVLPGAPGARHRHGCRIEEAVHARDRRAGRLLRHPRPGRRPPGAVADLVVFALDELEPGTEVRAHDLPGGAWRYSRTPGGYRATIVGRLPDVARRRRHRRPTGHDAARG